MKQIKDVKPGDTCYLCFECGNQVEQGVEFKTDVLMPIRVDGEALHTYSMALCNNCIEYAFYEGTEGVNI